MKQVPAKTASHVCKLIDVDYHAASQDVGAIAYFNLNVNDIVHKLKVDIHQDSSYHFQSHFTASLFDVSQNKWNLFCSIHHSAIANYFSNYEFEKNPDKAKEVLYNLCLMLAHKALSILK
jgi:hypothetical protein